MIRLPRNIILEHPFFQSPVYDIENILKLELLEEKIQYRDYVKRYIFSQEKFNRMFKDILIKICPETGDYIFSGREAASKIKEIVRGYYEKR